MEFVIWSDISRVRLLVRLRLGSRTIATPALLIGGWSAGFDG